MLALGPAGGHPVRAEEHPSDAQYVLRAEIPGVDPDREIEVTVRRAIVMITVRRHPDCAGTHRSEFRYGNFTRSFQLPSHVDENRIRASCYHGVLGSTALCSDEACSAASGPDVRSLS